jgi:transcriptional regulator of heat shock response
MLGRIQYDYSDVDFVKLPQFITRNILDTADGPIHLNKLAVDQYTKMQLEQRENFQNEWLQRRSEDRLQRKLFPIHTMGKKV